MGMSHIFDIMTIFFIYLYILLRLKYPSQRGATIVPPNFIVCIKYNFCWKPLCNLTKSAITPCGVCLWPGNMSCGCLLFVHLRCHQWEDCDLVFLHTLLPEAIIRRAQERTRSIPPSSPFVTREQNEYISGETQTARQSQLSSHQQLSSGMFAVFIQVEWQDRGSEDWYKGWCITLYGVWTPPVHGGMELLSMQDTCPEYEVTHRDEFWGGIHQDKTFLSWDTTNNGTFSKC